MDGVQQFCCYLVVVDFRDELGIGLHSVILLILLTLVVMIRKCLLFGVKAVLGFNWRLTSLLKGL